MRHCHCLQSMWYSIRERQSIITPFKNSVPDLPTLQQGTPRVPRAGTSDAPVFLSLQCKQGRFMPRRKRPCACIYKGLRFSNQVYCKKEGRESLFAEMGSEEMRTSERQTTEWGTEIVALSCLWRRIIKWSYIKKKRNSQGLGKYFATKATPGLYLSYPHSITVLCCTPCPSPMWPQVPVYLQTCEHPGASCPCPGCLCQLLHISITNLIQMWTQPERGKRYLGQPPSPKPRGCTIPPCPAIPSTLCSSLKEFGILPITAAFPRKKQVP